MPRHILTRSIDVERSICVSCKEIKVWSVSMIEMTGGEGRGSVGIRGSILYVHKRNERTVPTLVLFQSISGPRDEIERERVGACVIPKVDSKFWTGDHSIRKSYIKGIQCSFCSWTYNILPPILSSTLHISLCVVKVSLLWSNLQKKVSTFNNAQSILLDSYVLLDSYSRWFPICFQPRECACSHACSSY